MIQNVQIYKNTLCIGRDISLSCHIYLHISKCMFFVLLFFMVSSLGQELYFACFKIRINREYGLSSTVLLPNISGALSGRLAKLH